jgi:O-antigen/teichoic acid export membrane protein
MRRSFLKNLSHNFFQLFVNQLFGLVIFLALSKILTKEEFGAFNWALAILLLAFGFLSFGMDQLFVKKVASGQPISSLLSIYLVHVVVTGLLFLGIVAIIVLFLPYSLQYQLLFLLAIGKMALYFSTPFKLMANGLEKFKQLKWMSITANLLKAVVVCAFAWINRKSLYLIVPFFILCEVLELIFCIYIGRKLSTNLHFSFSRNKYLSLAKESLPQLGVVFFAAILSRFDWIYIGLFSSPVKLAEYSFAYKVYELASTPLLVIAPMLIPLFVRKQQKQSYSEGKMITLLRIQLIIAALTVLLLNLAWEPVVDPLTNNKYGTVNSKTILLLSLCLPFQYLNNFLWSFHFAKGALKMILRIFFISFCVDITSVLILVPLLGNDGAALAYLLAIGIQTVFYVRQTKLFNKISLIQPLFFCLIVALLSVFMVRTIFKDIYVIIFFGILIYVWLLILTGQLKRKDIYGLKAAVSPD